ncbi:P-loop NTPase fold protein [Pleionea sp. CnH1-48]|uniref:KAP family P-loop NTPase fold protein n=1 Tax=Pleionea sp. CnH1-48 TaxID=2954494 RepID=UPI002097E6B7|nr:P-loop NTPase fold protein [Pleionea sp. CnH1-48]MCO7226476.1 KAP family NTPase [Pleionea sp. CnH1-48]
MMQKNMLDDEMLSQVHSSSLAGDWSWLFQEELSSAQDSLINRTLFRILPFFALCPYQSKEEDDRYRILIKAEALSLIHWHGTRIGYDVHLSISDFYFPLEDKDTASYYFDVESESSPFYESLVEVFTMCALIDDSLGLKPKLIVKALKSLSFAFSRLDNGFNIWQLFVTAIKNDIRLYQNKEDLMVHPLWHGDVPELLQPVLNSALRSVYNDLPIDFASRYESLLRGEHIESVYSEFWPAVLESAAREKEGTINTGRLGSIIPESTNVKDRLGRSRLVSAIADFLDTPEHKGELTIGLLGDWGAGKSTVLRLLKEKLKSNAQNEWKVAEFNAWTYEHCENIQAGIAQECVQGLTKGYSFWQKDYLYYLFARRYNFSSYLFYCGLAVVTVVGIVLGLIYSKTGVTMAGIFASLVAFFQANRNLTAHPLADKLNTYLTLSFFGKHLGTIPIMKRQVDILCDICLNGVSNIKASFAGINRAHKTFEATKKRRLLFIIDDLDRCSKEGIVKVLEAVRLVMTQKNVTVVIAVDHRIALSALACHYADLAEHRQDSGAQDIARQYLGKIIQLPVVLTPAPETELSNYIHNTLFQGNLLDESNSSVKDNNDAAISSELDEPKQNQAIIQEERKESEASNVDKDKQSSPTEEQVTRQEAAADHKPTTESKSQSKAPSVLRHSSSELSHFHRLVKVYEFSNPRQIKRLFNSYRLYRAYLDDGGELSLHNYQEKETSLYLPAMSMIFWLEYCNQMNCGKAEGILDKKMKAVCDFQPENTQEAFKQMLFESKQWKCLNDGMITEENYEALRLSVHPFILPGTLSV